MWKIKYCGSWNYKPQAESLSVDMNNAGLPTTFEEGETGQFELFQSVTIRKTKHMSTTDWISYMKEGIDIPKFFTLADVEKKLSGR